VINDLAEAREPSDRDSRRRLRIRYLGSFREIQRAGLLFRHGSLIASKDFLPEQKSKSRPRVSLFDREPLTKKGGSNTIMRPAETSQQRPRTLLESPQQTPMQQVPQKCALQPEFPKIESVVGSPSKGEMSAAGRALRSLPRRRKVWSGWLQGQRIRRLTPVIIPGGRLLTAYLVRRGWVYVVLPDTPEFQGRFFNRYRSEDVQIFRSPEAALLGRRKSGKKERRSELKGRTARANGRCPCRPGRRRGRPKKQEFQT
jgi:hypothetical protein